METVIADTGPLVAYLCAEDADHAWAVGQFRELSGPLLTCEAVLSEAFFLLQQTRTGFEPLATMIERGLVVVDFQFGAHAAPILRLLRKYRDVPMSLADACLVRLAERHPRSRIFTLDSDFKVYRRNGRQVIPLIYPG